MFASPIDVPTVQRLSEEFERIVAIKDSSGDLPHMIRMIKAVRPNRPDFSFLTGWDAALMPMLLIGCDGGTNATSGIVPEMTRKLFDLTIGGRIDEARELQYKLVGAVRRHDVFGRFSRRFSGSAVAARLPAGRRPAAAVATEQQIELAAVRDTLQCLLAEEGFADEPIGGCPPGGRGPMPRRVDQIVQGVLAELKRRGMVNEV